MAGAPSVVGRSASTYATPEPEWVKQEVLWETLGDGITVSEGGGRREDTIRHHFPPYRSLVVFNGTGTATSTLHDGNGDAVASGD